MVESTQQVEGAGDGALRPAGRARRLLGAHRRVKRAMGLLREASQTLAAELADADVVAELVVASDADVQTLVELLRVERYRRGRPLEVFVLSQPPASDGE